MRRNWIAGLAVVAMLAGACSSGDDGDTPSADTDAVQDDDRDATTGNGGSDGGGSDDDGSGDADRGSNGDGSDTAGGNSDEGNSDGSDTGDGDGDSGGADDASRAALTHEEICRLVPAEEVAAALGEDSVAAARGTSGTPQCSYAFTTDDGVRTDVTVAALRTEEDLDGLEGAAAFDRVIERNRQAAGGEVTETEVAVGDQALLLSTDSIHFGVVQLDWRIVTTIVSAEVADAAAATSLTQTVDVLAP